MVSSLQILKHWILLKRDDSEKVPFPYAFLIGFQHVLHMRFMCLPPTSISLTQS